MMRELCALVAGGAAACPEARVPELVALARLHRVHLLVAPRVPSEALRVEARVEALRDTLRVRELRRVTAALDAAGCAPVVFTGAAHALTHYTDSRRRARLDADVLIDPASRPRAAAALAALGYTRPPMTAGRYVMHQEMHVRPDAGVGEHVVDLHWRLANPNVLSRLPAHEALRSRAVAVEDGALHVASAADALVIACVHRAAHHAASGELLWIYDIHLVASRLTAEEWTLAAGIAQRAGVAGLVRDGLALAAGAFGDSAPAAVLDTLASAGREASALFLHHDLRPLDRLRADVAALGLVGGARLVGEHLFPPASYMRQKYALRSSLSLPLAYVRRIVSGARGWFAAAAPATQRAGSDAGRRPGPASR